MPDSINIFPAGQQGVALEQSHQKGEIRTMKAAKLMVLVALAVVVCCGAVAGSKMSAAERAQLRKQKLTQKYVDKLGVSEEKAKKVTEIMQKANEEKRKIMVKAKEELSTVLSEEEMEKMFPKRRRGRKPAASKAPAKENSDD